MPSPPPTDLIGSTSNSTSNSFDGIETGLDGLRNTRGETGPRRLSWGSTQSSRSNTPEPPADRRGFPRRDQFLLTIADGSRVVVKMEKELLVKKVFTLYGPFGRLLRGLEELFPLENVPQTPSSTSPVCRVGTNVVLVTSSFSLPFYRNIDSERTWCFRSDARSAIPHDLKLPLIPENSKWVVSVAKTNITEPYAVLFHRKVQHNKERSTAVETVEVRSIGASAEAENEVFPEPMDRKTEMAYGERIFVGEGVVRIVTEFTVVPARLGFTQITRHFWKCDLARAEPLLKTAREAPVSSTKVGSISDTSAGSPPSSNSPFTKMQRTDMSAVQLLSTAIIENSVVSQGVSESKVQKILRKRKALNGKGSDMDIHTAVSQLDNTVGTRDKQ